MAYATDGTNNTATVTGDGSEAHASYGENNTATVTGDDSDALAGTGDNNTATGCGDNLSADAYGEGDNQVETVGCSQTGASPRRSGCLRWSPIEERLASTATSGATTSSLTPCSIRSPAWRAA